MRKLDFGSFNCLGRERIAKRIQPRNNEGSFFLLFNNDYLNVLHISDAFSAAHIHVFCCLRRRTTTTITTATAMITRPINPTKTPTKIFFSVESLWEAVFPFTRKSPVDWEAVVDVEPGAMLSELAMVLTSRVLPFVPVVGKPVPPVLLLLLVPLPEVAPPLVSSPPCVVPDALDESLPVGEEVVVGVPLVVVVPLMLVQTVPLPLKPAEQEHKYEPRVFVQLALGSHVDGSAHSSVSEQSEPLAAELKPLMHVQK